MSLQVKVAWFRSLDLVLHGKKNIPVPRFLVDQCERHGVLVNSGVLMNRGDSWLLKHSVPSVRLPTGKYITATRVRYSRDSLSATVAATMRPGPQWSIKYDDHYLSFVAHVNDANAWETVKQRGNKVTVIRGYCDGCGESKPLRRVVPEGTTHKA